MCNHDWEVLSRISDGTGDLYIYYICQICGKTKEEIVDERRY